MNFPFNPQIAQDLMPLDRVTFETDLAIKSEATAGCPQYIKNVLLPGSSGTLKKEHKRERTIPIDLSPNGAVRLLVVDAGKDAYSLRRVEFNPGRLINGHNGQLLSTDQVVTAFAVVSEKIQPLLVDPGDAALLIPGCRPDSPSYWSSIEIDMHLHDPDDSLLLALRNVRIPEIRKKATIHEGESITLGNRRSDMMLSFYRKDLQMSRDLGKFGITDAAQVLRAEATLRKKKLLSYLGLPGNTGRLRSVHSSATGLPEPRLIRFRATEVIEAHQKIMAELRGISGVVVKGDLPSNERFGRMLGLLSRHANIPVETALDISRHRFSASPNTISRWRSAAIDELSLTTGSTRDLFSRENYANQPVISIPQLEAAGYPDDYPSDFRAAIQRNYGSKRASVHEA